MGNIGDEKGFDFNARLFALENMKCEKKSTKSTYS